MKHTRETWKPIGEDIGKLVDRINKLRPDHRNPHHFHEEKSEIAHDLSMFVQLPLGPSGHPRSAGNTHPDVSRAAKVARG